jgi:4'-phosphopantetheinyl transferase
MYCPDEREKAGRFRTLKLRQYYRRCRSALRLLLGRYSGQRPASIKFRYREFGKPEVDDPKWHFNLSHSENLALIAISLHPVGIDLEFINSLEIDPGLVDIVCHSSEKTALELLPVDERCRLFYELLTKKEAYCKALGVGLQHPLCALRFDVFSQVCDEHIDDAPLLFAYSIPSVAGYAASVCMPLADARIYLFKSEPYESMDRLIICPEMCHKDPKSVNEL